MLLALAVALLSGCVTPTVNDARPPVEVKIIAFNDFHGNLEPPKQSIEAPDGNGATIRVPAGGAAYLASAIEALRSSNPNNITVSAGDMIGASPLPSALFLDEPTIEAMNLVRVDLNAVGNHEFDKGRSELLRMQNGGCAKYTLRQPCALDKNFPGARFTYLAANVRTADGTTLFPSYSIRSFGEGKRKVRIGFIGLTLKGTPALVTPAGVAGLAFDDEADTINALIPKLRGEGADAIVVLIHQGVSTKVGYDDKSCAGMDGELLPILDRLDPKVDLVVSGHTHNAYICDYGRINPARPILVTSAGKHGTLVTDIRLTIDPFTHKVTGRQADNLIVQGEGYTGPGGAVPVTSLYPRYRPDPAVAALVERAVSASAPVAARVIGRLSAPALRSENAATETVLGDLVADAQLAATRDVRTGGAQIAFMNPTGVRDHLVPAADGSVSYGQIFAVHPFGNTIVVKSLTGLQIRALLEQQFDSGGNSTAKPNLLFVSSGFTYGYDLSRPAGRRIFDPRLGGTPLDDSKVYRVAMNSFLASGGDNFTIFTQGTDQLGGPQDVDALEAYIAASSPLVPPEPKRVSNLTPR